MKYKILALDQASNCGWAIGDLYGTWDFTTRKDESSGMKWIRLKTKLAEVHKAEKLDLIVYERPAGMHQSAVIHSAKMVAIIEEFCESNAIAYRSYSAKEIKKYATGNGNANKAAMVVAAKEKYKYDGISDNEADAMHLYNLAKDQYET